MHTAMSIPQKRWREESWICLEITSWGVQVTGEDDAGGITFWLDKEYFIDTPLWHYMEPDF